MPGNKPGNLICKAIKKILRILKIKEMQAFIALPDE
jgi:hypothetical protein